MTPERARERTPHLPPAYRLVALEEIDSTNAEAKRLAEAGAEDGTLVWARRQTAGYGRQGRAWSSEPGNLFISLVVRRSEEHTSELKSLMRISYAVFCLQKNKHINHN